jgi:hypothetical protein
MKATKSLQYLCKYLKAPDDDNPENQGVETDPNLKHRHFNITLLYIIAMQNRSLVSALQLQKWRL